jgi:hypothetical protein
MSLRLREALPVYRGMAAGGAGGAGTHREAMR